MIGQTLGAYRIVEQIGMGGMATVYKAYHAAMDRYVAVKVLPAHFAQDPTFLERFRREAKTIARLEHRHILPVYDFGEQENVTYLVMRYLDAGTLRDKIKVGPLPLQQATDYLRQMGSALDYAHRQKVIHRDVKPSNVLIDQESTAFISDFGISKMVGATADLTGMGMVGTPAYMSPEQGRGEQASALSDQYALGVVLYEMVIGQVPYEAETPMAILLMHMNAPLPLPSTARPGLPEDVERVILKTLAKEPQDRFDSCTALADAFEKAVAGLPVHIVERSSAIEEARAPTAPASGGPLDTVPMDTLPARATAAGITRAWQQQPAALRWLLVALGGGLAVMGGFFGVRALGAREGAAVPTEMETDDAAADELSATPSASGEGSAADTLQLTQEVSFDPSGISMSLPEGWEVKNFQFLFYSYPTPDTAIYDALTAPYINGTIGPTSMLAPESATPEDVLALYPPQEYLSMEKMQVGEPTSLTVGGLPAVSVFVEDTDTYPGTPIRGRAIAVLGPEQTGILMATAPIDEWEAFEPAFETVLQTVTFSSPRAAIVDEDELPGLATLDPESLTTPAEGKLLVPCDLFDLRGGVCFESVPSGEVTQIAPEIDAQLPFSWNPDGESVLGTVYENGSPETIMLYSIRSDDTDTQALSSMLANLHAPTWSPDGEWLAFVSDEGVEVARPDGADRKLVLANSEGSCVVSAPQWSPFDYYLAIARQVNGCLEYPMRVEFVIISKEGIELNAIIIPAVFEESSPCLPAIAFGPDFTHVAYQDGECRALLIEIGFGYQAVLLDEWPVWWTGDFYPQWGGL